ncbi:MAG: phosphoglucomutase/phosphomannomutase family protein [Anaerolineaceae bacterium]|nr:phosphoglucomutase/phosphomannomutase family protein [Anaerolineaceae bacterium]
MIRFGTDGWRAVIADTFTFENLRLIAQAVADWVNLNHSGSSLPEVVIGYDTRFLSDRFAAEAARVMAGNSIVAWLTRNDSPTPAVSYNVKAKGANAGIVITASHNPPRYNGFKLKAAYGGSAVAEDCAQVEEALLVMEREARGPNLMDYQKAVDKELIRTFDPSWTYYQHLGTLVDLDKISAAELNIVVDAMWGAGRGAFPSILSRSRGHVTSIRDKLNPGFGGIHPEPIARYLKELVAAVQQNQANVGLATDGDADRIGAIDALGNFIDPHTVFALTLRQLVEGKGQRGDVVKTVSTTLMIDSICEKHGLTLHETPVGFNHIADLMGKKDVLIGGEESGGISVRGHIPEGDGILMGLLLLEVMAEKRAPLHEIVADLQVTFGPALYDRIDVRLAHQVPKKQMVKMLVDAAPKQVGGESIVKVETLDGVKFYLADHSWLLIRPSGTEPLLRIYAEARTADMRDALLKMGSELGNKAIG